MGCALVSLYRMLHRDFREFLFYDVREQGRQKGPEPSEKPQPSAIAAYHYSFTLNYPTVKNHLYCCGRGLAARSLAPVVTTAL